MEQIERNILIREAIISNSFHRLSSLVESSTQDVDFSSNIGDTPLLLCLKMKRDYSFIECLIRAGASLTQLNKYGICAISFAVSYRDNLVTKMLEDSRHTPALLETPYSEEMLQAFKDFKCKILIYITNENQINQRVLLCMKSSFSLFYNNIALRELNAFLDDLSQWGDMEFNTVSKLLLEKAYNLANPVMFNVLWPRLDKKYIFEMQRNFLSDYIIRCKFSNSDFRKCLDLILKSKYARNLRNPTYPPFKYVYSSVFRRLRRETKSERLETLTQLLKIYPPTIDNVIEAYILYGFEEEELLFVQAYAPKDLTENDYISLLGFLRRLEKNKNLRLDKLHELSMSLRLCYHKLLFLMPQVYLQYDTQIEEKKQFLDKNKFSNDTWKYSVQRWVQRRYLETCVIL